MADPQQVNDFHAYADTDTGDLASHHTLGYGANQAAPGLKVNRRFIDAEDRLTSAEGRLTTLEIVKPAAYLTNNATQALVANTAAVVSLQTNIQSQGTVTVASTYIEVGTAGFYSITGSIQLSTAAANKLLALRVNATVTAAIDASCLTGDFKQTTVAGVSTILEVAIIPYLNVGDRIHLIARSSVADTIAATTFCHLSAVRVA